MKKHLPLMLAALYTLLAWNPADAYEIGAGQRQQSPQAILADLLLLRPFGLGMTLTGTALMIGASPLVAIASVAPPHDAFERTGNALVVAPAAFTFLRPLGEFTYQADGVYPVRP